jgi:hypothetical protein
MMCIIQSLRDKTVHYARFQGRPLTPVPRAGAEPSNN